MTKADLAALRVLAMAATPGPWFLATDEVAYEPPTLATEDDHERSHTVTTDPKLPGWNTDGGYPGYSPSKANCEFMAAANPKTILELLDMIRGLA